MKRTLISIFILMLLAAPAMAQEFGVYVKALEQAEGSFEDSVKATEDALNAAGYDVLASYASGVEEECGLRAHNIAFLPTGYANKIMAHGPTAAFTLPLRASIYEDESGINLDFINPSSINRTVLGDDIATELSASVAQDVANILSGSIKGKAINEQIGKVRKKGYVGGMGGGKFLKKIETVHEGGSYADIAAKVKEGISTNTLGWKLVYSFEPAEGISIFGITNLETEARSFDIAGQKRSNKNFKCPGLDHAPAYPIEIVVYSEDGKAKVVILDGMYRMKVYFEDAGNFAFMKNMTMPGHIENEIEEIITSKLK